MSAELGPSDSGPVGQPAPLPPERARGLLRRSRAIGRWKRVGYVVAGVTCLVIGVIGGFLPILQGWIFIGLGIAFLAPVFPPARRAMVWAFRRWPRLRRAIPKRFRRRAQLLEEEMIEEEVPVT
jgi:hypothetical protein